METEFLYHGSTELYEVLIPHQAYDTGFAAGCQNAVYATSDKNMAIAFAMGTQWVCSREVKPVEVMEIEVNDYLHLCKVENDNKNI